MRSVSELLPNLEMEAKNYQLQEIYFLILCEKEDKIFNLITIVLAFN